MDIYIAMEESYKNGYAKGAADVRGEMESREAIYEKAFRRFGEEKQIVVAIEEMTECQKELCKFLRGIGNAGALAEEIADAMIGLEEMVWFFGLEEMVRIQKARKLMRLESRTQGGDGHGTA